MGRMANRRIVLFRIVLCLGLLIGMGAPAWAAGQLHAVAGGAPAGPLPASGYGKLPSGAVIYVPPGLAGHATWPVALVLHGAGQYGAYIAVPLQRYADEWGVVLVAPDASSRTWDWLDVLRQQGAIRSKRTFGRDLKRIDTALQEAFAVVPVDRQHLSIIGFSDGATYGLDVGIRNPELFGQIIALSPGDLPEVARGPGAKIFVAHGDEDPVLPVKQTVEKTIPKLRRRGFDVVYHEFHGGHVMAEAALRHAFDTWLCPRTPSCGPGQDGRP